MTSETICTILEGILCLVAGIAGSAYYSWRMTAVCIGIIPFVMLGGIIMATITHGKVNEKNYEVNVSRIQIEHLTFVII